MTGKSGSFTKNCAIVFPEIHDTLKLKKVTKFVLSRYMARRL